jgi:hypothetical protein
MTHKDIEAHLHMTFKFPMELDNKMLDNPTELENAIAEYLEKKLGMLDVNIYDSQFIDYDLEYSHD